MYEKVFLNKYGFYELKNKPFVEDMKKDFENCYFQNSKGNYENTYSEKEKKFFDYKMRQKRIIIEKNITFKSEKEKTFLDIGCGEGYAIKYFYLQGYDVCGIDFSKYGIEQNNPDMLPYFIQGDCIDKLKKLNCMGKQYKVINMDESLDMMLDLKIVLNLCNTMLCDDGVLIIKVANNYSVLQRHLLNNKMIDNEFWLDEEGHPYYFNKNGLINLLDDFGFNCEEVYGESFIDLNLFNENTNYQKNRTVGKSCYLSRIDLELFMNSISEDKTLEVFKTLGEMGLGREIIGVFKKR